MYYKGNTTNLKKIKPTNIKPGLGEVTGEGTESKTRWATGQKHQVRSSTTQKGSAGVVQDSWGPNGQGHGCHMTLHKGGVHVLEDDDMGWGYSE